jgi:hypothetical protein
VIVYLIGALLSLFFDLKKNLSLIQWQLTYYLCLILVALRSENLTVWSHHNVLFISLSCDSDICMIHIKMKT